MSQTTKKHLFGILALTLLIVPYVAHADTLFTILGIINDTIRFIVPFLIGLALIYFLWGVIRYILYNDDPSVRASSRQIMIWGIIILFVLVSIWGLVNILIETFVQPEVAPDVQDLVF